MLRKWGFQSDERLSLEHALFNLRHNIPPIMLPNKYNAPPSSAHSTSPSKSMNEIYRGVWYVVQYNIANSKCVDASRAQIGGDQHLGVG